MPFPQNHRRPMVWICLSFVLALLGLWPFLSERTSSNQVAAESRIEAPRLSLEQLYPHIVPRQSALYTVLRGLDVSSQTIHQLVAAAKPVMDLGRLNPGARFRLKHDGTDLIGIDFRFSAVDKLELKKNGEGVWSAQKIPEKVDTKIISFKGIVSNSLWESSEAANMDPYLVCNSRIFSLGKSTSRAKSGSMTGGA